MTPVPETVETDRLRLERLCEANVDFETFHEIYSAEEMESVAEYVVWDRPRSRENSRALFENEVRKWEEGTKFSYVVRPVGDDDLPADQQEAFAGVTKLFVDEE